MPSADIAELAVIVIGFTSIRTYNIIDREIYILHPDNGTWNEVSGEIITVKIHKSWVFGQVKHLAGSIINRRLDAAALDLPPLKLCYSGAFDIKHILDEEDLYNLKKLSFYEPILAASPKPAYEMEQIIPGYDWSDPDSDPICQAVDARHVGDYQTVWRLLDDCLRGDLRCLDAHAHYGSFTLSTNITNCLEEAFRHYSVGVAIGSLSLGSNFTGTLPWEFIDNRPYLRCLHGLGLCWWQKGQADKAWQVFQQLLQYNPTDSQGVRFILYALQRGLNYEQYQREEEVFEQKFVDLLSPAHLSAMVAKTPTGGTAKAQTANSVNDSVYQFRIDLDGIRPPIWRRILVPANYTFYDLHMAIQKAMGWDNYHLYCFEIKHPITGEKVSIYASEESRFDDLIDFYMPVVSFFPHPNMKCTYTYDFGDNWKHIITLEKILPKEPGMHYPVCLAGKRSCPPEDCGGPFGYMMVISGEGERAEYYKGFDPEDFDPIKVKFSTP